MASNAVTYRSVELSFHQAGKTVPKGLAHIIKHYGTNRQEVYKRMFGILKYGAKLGEEEKPLAFPKVIRDFLRERFEGQSPTPSGSRDADYDDPSKAYLVTIQEMAQSKWPAIPKSCKKC